MTHATGTRSAGKVQKPHKSFPLFPHASGRWCKKLKGKFQYFGRTADDPDGQKALKLWLEQKDDLLAGRKVSKDDAGKLTLRELVNAFLDEKERLRASGEITSLTFSEYFKTCDRVVETFGRTTAVASLRAEDFSRLRAKLATTRGAVSLGNEIVRVKMVFSFGAANGLIPAAPLYGQSFSKPKRKVLAIAEATRGPKDFTATELRKILKASQSNPSLHAMTWLACNCAYGNRDLSELPIDAVDLVGGWATFARVKTGVPRRAKLWRETIKAVKEYLKHRSTPRDASDEWRLFLTTTGRPFVRINVSDDRAKCTRSDIVGSQFGRLLKTLGINGRRNFYAIRHSYQLAAEASLDMPSVMSTMGHRDQSISARYRGTIPDVRLEGVSRAVHAWLFGAEGGEE